MTEEEASSSHVARTQNGVWWLSGDIGKTASTMAAFFSDIS